MSKIIEKAFDASKKIIRSIFKGSPNLFTTSDLNRQFEAMKSQMDNMNERIGFSSDFELDTVATKSENSVTIRADYDYTYIFYKGCRFSPQKNTLNFTLTSASPLRYVCLVADIDTITYETDFSHTIAGAKFEDGTSRPAADQVVYKDETIEVLSDPDSTDRTFVGILAVVELTDVAPYYHKVKTNCMQDWDSLRLNVDGSFLLNPNLRQPVTSAMSYSDAISVIYNKFNALCPSWTRFKANDEEYDTEFADFGMGNKFSINNGHLFIDTTQVSFGVMHDYTDSASTPRYIVVGKFPTNIETTLIDLFNECLSYKDIQKKSFPPGNVPMCILGTFTTIQVYSFVYPDLAGQEYQRDGLASLCLAATFSTTGDRRINGVKVIFKVDSLRYNSANKGYSAYVSLYHARMCYFGDFPDIVSVPLPITTF